MSTPNPMPRGVARRIMERAAKSKDRVLVVVTRNGKPTRVFDFDKYVEKKETTKRRQPWKQRRKAVTPDPLGAIDAKVLRPLTRDEMYED